MDNVDNSKVDIITFHFVNNFGGVLQAYALQEALEQTCNLTAEIIDYRNGFISFTDAVRLFPITKNVDEVLAGIRTMPDRLGRISKFKRFRNCRMHCTKQTYHHCGLKSNPPKAVAYICGSDQIWNPYLTLGVKGAYFLDFVDENAKKIAYAPSFGKSQLNPFYLNRISGYINRLDCISVREATGVDLIENMVGKRVEQLIDPTFLLTKECWENTAASINKKQPYILLYIMQSDKTMYDYARKLKDKLGIRIIEISRYGYNPGFIDETLVDVGPAEFLGLIKNADYVCTNSYHGFIFSLIFEKRFFLIPCKRFRTRIYNLADMLCINMINKGEKETLETFYDLELVRERICKEREKALRWLRKSIGLVEI